MKTDNYRETAPEDDEQFQTWLRATAAEAKTASGERKKILLDALPLHDVCVYLNEIDVNTICFMAYNDVFTLADLAEKAGCATTATDKRIARCGKPLLELYNL